MRVISAISVLIIALCGCGKTDIPLAYEQVNSVNRNDFGSVATGFSENIAVTVNDVSSTSGFSVEEMSAAGLFDVNRKKVLYSQNIHETMYPASLTKIMTLICALKHSSLDDVITCTENVTHLESGASACGLSAGDKLTMNQALHLLMLPSANDAAVAIAEHISGSTEEFCALMNEEAKKIGATKTNFVNPHGLSNENHYTTCYDMYLITNEALKYNIFNEIIQKSEYDCVITNSSGGEKPLSVKSSNKFLDGSYASPDNITVIGGKTGTTNAAGHCLVLITKDSAGNPYISVIMKASERSVLYQEMIDLLKDIK